MAGPYYVDSNTSSLWVASQVVALGARRVCTTAAAVASRGYVKECTTAGTTGATEPVWTDVPGDTITDGTAVWTTREATDIANASAFLYYINNHKLAAGERVWIRSTHSETTTAAVTLTEIGTAAAPVEWLIAGTWANNPTTISTGAIIASGANLNLRGFAYGEGVEFSLPNHINIGNNTTPSSVILKNSILRLNTTNSAYRINVGNVASTSNDDQVLTLINTPTIFGNVAQGIVPRCRMIWRDTPVITPNIVPDVLIQPPASAACEVELSGLDLSMIATGKAVFGIAGASPSRLVARNCKLGASGSITSGTIPGQGGAIVTADNVSSSAINYSEYQQSYEGVLIQETTIVKTGGSSDGTTTLSCKMTSSAGTKFYAPLYSRWMPVWIDTVAVAKTIAVDILHDSLTALTDAEAWIEVKYLSSATVPIESSVSDAAVSLVAAGVAQDTSAATWTTTGLTNPNKQKLVSPAFTTQMKGYALARVAVAKPSYTVYLDGNPQVA